MIKKTFGNYQLISCTAIAFSADAESTDSDRQDAILVRDLAAACAGDTDQVLFGYSLDEMDEDAFKDACIYDSCAFSLYDEDLDSILIDGKPLSTYVHGGL